MLQTIDLAIGLGVAATLQDVVRRSEWRLGRRHGETMRSNRRQRMSMRSELGYAFTVMRWLVAFACISMGVSMLRVGDASPGGAALILLVGAVLIGLEIYLRRTRKTLVLQDGKVEVLQRGVSLGSFPAEFVQYWDLASRVRALVKALLVSFICFFVFGALFYFIAGDPLGLGLLFSGLVFSGAAVWEFRVLWQIVVPKPGAGYMTMNMSKPGGAQPIAITIPSERWVILLRKPDVVKLLGFWPADKPRK